MHRAIDTPDATSNVRCEELPPPGCRSGEGTETLWQHMARDEMSKMANRGGGRREDRRAQEVPHPGRRATDHLDA
jgi:hypothetical protein